MFYVEILTKVFGGMIALCSSATLLYFGVLGHKQDDWIDTVERIIFFIAALFYAVIGGLTLIQILPL